MYIEIDTVVQNPDNKNVQIDGYNYNPHWSIHILEEDP